ncbi:MAG: amidohydrolase, partial [Alphaproteobacteria bacterium]|nr:amidohydrolase [Alphaproteobacteria bacterium]
MIRMLIAAALFLGFAPAFAQQGTAQPQMERVPDRPAGEGEGPYGTLLIKDAIMIDGTGAPPEGPVSILIEGNRIARIIRGGGE